MTAEPIEEFWARVKMLAANGTAPIVEELGELCEDATTADEILGIVLGGLMKAYIDGFRAGVADVAGTAVRQGVNVEMTIARVEDLEP